MHQTTGELTVRAANRHDRLAICTLLQQAWHSAGMARWDQIDAIETGCEALLVLRDGLAIGFSLLDLRALPVARLSAVAVADREDVSAIWGELWPAAERYMSDQGVRQAYYVGEAPWLLDILAGQGFRRTNSLVSYEKVQDGPTLAGNPAVHVRAARSGETRAAAEIDATSFPPLWRYSQSMLHTAMQANARLTLAELDRRPVGYQLCVHEGNTGQVVRLAVLPEYRRQAIGSRLLADALTTFIRRHVRRVAVNTQGDNLPAQRLYERFGFRSIGDELPVLEKTLAH